MPKGGYNEARFITQFYRGKCHGSILMNIATQCFWSPAVWKENKRARDNFEFADFGALDFENPLVTIEMIERSFCDSWYFIGITRNHQKQKGKIPPMDRFRLVFKWERRILELKEYEYNVDKLADCYGADLSSCSAQHPFFPCQKIVSFNFEEGVLNEPVLPYEEETRPSHEDFIERQERNLSRGIFSGRTKAALSQEVEEGGRHKIFFRVACELARAGIERAEAEYSILSSPTFAGKPMTKDLVGTIKDVRRAIFDAYRIVFLEKEKKKGV